MGAGCSTQTTAVDRTQKRPPLTSQSSARLLSALGGLAAVQTDHKPTEPKPEGQKDEQPTQAGGEASTAPSPKPAEPLLLTPGIEIHPHPDKPLLKQRQTIPQFDLDGDKDSSTGSLSLSSSSSTSKSTSLPVPSSTASDGSAPSSPAQPRQFSIENSFRNDANRRRSNSISILPSIEPKPKLAGSTQEVGGKKSDQDLVLWISNKLKTKLKLARISKAYDRY